MDDPATYPSHHRNRHRVTDGLVPRPIGGRLVAVRHIRVAVREALQAFCFHRRQPPHSKLCVHASRRLPTARGGGHLERELEFVIGLGRDVCLQSKRRRGYGDVTFLRAPTARWCGQSVSEVAIDLYGSSTRTAPLLERHGLPPKRGAQQRRMLPTCECIDRIAKFRVRSVLRTRYVRRIVHTVLDRQI